MEAVQQQLLQMQQAIDASAQREQQLQQQVQFLQQQAQQAQIENRMPQLLQRLEDLTIQLASNHGQKQVTLFDNKGIGKPGVFKGAEEHFLPWKTKVENFIVNVFPDLAEALEWAEEKEGECTDAEIRTLYEDPNSLDHLPQVQDKQHQLFTVSQQLCEKEPFDIVSNCGKGKGLEAWRRLNKRYDPSTANRKKALLKHILNPERAKLDDLSGALEKWIDSVRMYERRKDSQGTRCSIADDIKVAVLESRVPVELEKHMQLNRSQYETFEKALAAISEYIESRTGAKLSVNTRHTSEST